MFGILYGIIGLKSVQTAMASTQTHNSNNHDGRGAMY